MFGCTSKIRKSWGLLWAPIHLWPHNTPPKEFRKIWGLVRAPIHLRPHITPPKKFRQDMASVRALVRKGPHYPTLWGLHTFQLCCHPKTRPYEKWPKLGPLLIMGSASPCDRPGPQLGHRGAIGPVTRPYGVYIPFQFCSHPKNSLYEKWPKPGSRLILGPSSLCEHVCLSIS